METRIPLVSPLHAKLRLDKTQQLIKELNQEYHEGKNERSLMENARYQDAIASMKGIFWETRHAYRGSEAYMRAQLN